MISSDLGPLTTPQGTAGKNVQKKLARLAHKYAEGGKVPIVMREFKHGKLHSGSKKGPKVTNRKQAIAIALSEERNRLKGKYARGGGIGWWDQLHREMADIQRSPLQKAYLHRAEGGEVKMRHIAHEVVGEHIKHRAPKGHKGLEKVMKGKKKWNTLS